MYEIITKGWYQNPRISFYLLQYQFQKLAFSLVYFLFPESEAPQSLNEICVAPLVRRSTAEFMIIENIIAM